MVDFSEIAAAVPVLVKARRILHRGEHLRPDESAGGFRQGAPEQRQDRVLTFPNKSWQIGPADENKIKLFFFLLFFKAGSYRKTVNKNENLIKLQGF